MKNATLTYSHGEIKSITGVEDFAAELKFMRSQGPQIAILEVPGLGILTFGIGSEFGFVEFMTSNREPPYLFANNEKREFSEEFIVFDAGGTITPVPKSQCLSIGLVEKILCDSLLTKKLPEYVNWIEE